MKHHGLFSSFILLALIAVGPIGAKTPQSAKSVQPAKIARSGIAPVIQPFVSQHHIAGAVTLVADKGKVLSLEACGLADIKNKTPMRADHIFWIASMTKPMTATALMMMVDEGKVDIDAPVEKYLPEFKGQMLAVEKDAEHVLLRKPARPVIVKDLLTHTSGLASGLPTGGTSLDTLTLAGAVIGYAVSPLQFEPGSKWQYCNPGINTLGRIVEVTSGMSFGEFMQKRVFDPLGMKDTSFWPTEAQMKRLVTAYKLDKETHRFEETKVAHLTFPYSDRRRMALPAGGLFSCAGDLVKFYQMALNGGSLNGRVFLKPETMQKMTSNQMGDMKVSFTDGMNMGLGWHIVDVPQGVTESLSPGSFGHGGAYGTQAWLDPQKDLIMVLLIQHANIGNADGSELRRAFQNAAAALGR